MKKLLTLILFGLLSIAQTAHAEETSISISAAPPGGPWYVGIGAYVKVINSMFPELNAAVFPGVGVANVVHVGQNKSQVGVTCTALMAAGVNGTDPYKKAENIKALGNFNDISVAFVAIPEGSRIKSIDQIVKEKAKVRIDMGSKIGGFAELFQRWMLAEYGLDKKTIESWGGKMLPLGKNEAVAMLQNRQIDLELDMNSGNFPSKYQEVLNTVNLEFLDIPEHIVAAMVEKHPGLNAGIIPKGHMNGYIDRDITTFTATNGLIINADVPDETAYKLAKALHLGAKDIGLAFPGWGNMTTENICKGMPIEIHPGAAKYYREIGCLQD